MVLHSHIIHEDRPDERNCRGNDRIQFDERRLIIGKRRFLRINFRPFCKDTVLCARKPDLLDPAYHRERKSLLLRGKLHCSPVDGDMHDTGCHTDQDSRDRNDQ